MPLSRGRNALVNVALLLAAAGGVLSRQDPEPKARPKEEPKATYALVVNVRNKTTATGDEARATVKKLFLKDLTQWPDGLDARPYAREDRSAEQAAFVKAVLGMNDPELARHWLRLKSTNGTTPPKEVDSDRLLLKYVARHDGAFGIIRIDAARAAPDVRILFEF